MSVLRDPAAAAAPELELLESGRQLGHDFWHFSRLDPRGDWPPSVVEGFAHARSIGSTRRAPDLYTRKWLQLRLGALARQRFVSAQVTPAFLARIDVAECPVLRVTLTRGERAPTDWSVDRLHNDAAYAPNNLAVMSTRANLAKGSRSFEAVYSLAQGSVAVDGLQPVEWLRLAAMMLGPCFAHRPAETPPIPSPIPLPNCTVRTALQQIQHAFASRAGRPAGKNALIKRFRPACTSEPARVRLGLLADAVHERLKSVERPWDVWLDPVCMARLTHWRDALTPQGLTTAGSVASAVIGGELLRPGRLADWRIHQRGYVG